MRAARLVASAPRTSTDVGLGIAAEVVQRSRLGCAGAEPTHRDRAARRPRSRRSAARSAPARCRWPRRSPTAMESGEHLLVQAGTGTGKSLAYLVPACCTTTGSWSPRRRSPCSTSSSSATSRRCSRRPATCCSVDTSYAVLKGRSNYACLHRIREGVPDDQGTLVDAARGVARRRGRRAARVGRGGGRGQAAPASATPRRGTPTAVWRAGQRQPPRVPRCGQVPVRRECFAERAREQGRTAPS